MRENHFLLFLCGLVVTLMVPNFAHISAPSSSDSASSGSVYEKTQFVKDRGNDFNLLILGDSKTYCGIDPLVLDSILGTRSFNLAGWGNGFLSVNPQVKDLLPTLTPRTAFLWIISTQNFLSSPMNNQVHFPLSLATTVSFIREGVDWELLRYPTLQSAFLSNIFGRLFPASFLTLRRSELSARLRHQGRATDTHSQDPLSSAADELINIARQSPEVASAKTKYWGGRITSVEIFKRRGNYERHVLDPSFFEERKKDEQKNHSDALYERKIPPLAYWRIYEDTVSLFRQSNKPLAIAWIRAAPSFYSNRHRMELEERWLTDARRYAGERNIPFVILHEPTLSENDYFDDSHLTFEGAKRLSLFAAHALSFIPPLIGHAQ